MNIESVTPNCGARVTNVDLRGPIDETLAEALRQALYHHQVLFLPGQSLNLAEQKSVTALFGEPMQLPYVVPIDEDPEVVAVKKTAEEVNVGVFGGDWHSDFSFMEQRPIPLQNRENFVKAA